MRASRIRTLGSRPCYFATGRRKHVDAADLAPDDGGRDNDALAIG